MKYNEKVALLAQEVVIALATLRKANKPITTDLVRGALAGRTYVKSLLSHSNHDPDFPLSVENQPSPHIAVPSQNDSAQTRFSNAAWVLEYKNVLRRILDHFIGMENTPASQRLGEMIERLSGDLTAEELKDVEHQIFGALTDLVRDIENERGKLFDLLHELARELIRTESAFLASLVKNDKSRRRTSDQFDQRVTGFVSEVEDSVSKETSINWLQELVLDKMGAIRQSITDRRKAEDESARQFESRISRLKSNLEKSHKEMYHIQRKVEEDYLTGLFNRKALDRILAEKLEEFRESSSNIAFIMVDVDHFKRVNDGYGHLSGDRVLSAIGARPKASVGRADYVFRYAGDEFAVLLCSTDLVGALKLAESVRQAVAKTEFLHRETLVPVTVSLGVTMFKQGDRVEDIVERADAALYQAKQDGRDSVRANT